MFHDEHTPPSFQSTRRILGLKLWQAAVLGGFLVLDLIVLVVGIGLVLSASPPTAPTAPLAATAAPLTATAGPTDTPAPTETSTPTKTPTDVSTITPPPTGTPTIDPLAGWTTYLSDKLTFKLPESFVCGNPRTDSAAIIARLTAKGATFDAAVLKKTLQSYGPDTLFWAMDSFPSGSALPVNLSILFETTQPESLMADDVTRILDSFAKDYSLVEQRQIINRSFEVQQVTMIPKDPNLAVDQVAVYVMKSNDVLLGVICAAPVDDWSARLRQFDEIIKSIQLIPLQPIPSAT